MIGVGYRCVFSFHSHSAHSDETGPGRVGQASGPQVHAGVLRSGAGGGTGVHVPTGCACAVPRYTLKRVKIVLQTQVSGVSALPQVLKT